MVWGRITLSFIFVLFYIPLSLACTTPTGDDTLINGSVVICPGTYNINDINYDGLFIFSDNDTLDCNGSTFSGDGEGYGAYLDTKRNVTVMNCTFRLYSEGVFLYGGSNNTIQSNTIMTAQAGIDLVYAGSSWSDNTVMKNNISGCTPGIRSNINNTLIAKNHITGTGFIDEPQLPSANVGITNSRVANITNNTVQNYSVAISATPGTFVDNTLSGNYFGLVLELSGLSSVRGNTFINNSQDVLIQPAGTYTCPIMENNTATRGELTYLNSTTTISGKNGTIVLCKADNSIVTGSNADIIIVKSNNVTISNSNVSHSNYGIYLASSDNTTITGNTISANKYGIYHPMVLSPGLIITNNRILNNSLSGVQFAGGRNGTIVNNTISGSKYGIVLGLVYEGSYGSIGGSTTYNITVSSNTIVNNSGRGFYLASSASGHLLFNNLFNNTVNAETATTVSWNTTLQNGTSIIGGGKIGGNYWAIPTGNGCSQQRYDANADGVSDTGTCQVSITYDYLPLTRLATQQAQTSITAPQNNTQLHSNVSINISFNNIANITISIINASGNTTTITRINNSQGPQNITWTTNNGLYPDGIYNLSVRVIDTNNAGNNVSVIVRNLTVDNTPPTWNQSITDITTTSAFLNITGTENTTYNISINNIQELSNTTINLTSTISALTPQTIYTLSATGCDHLNNCNTTNTTFTTETEPQAPIQESSHAGGGSGAAENLLTTPEEITTPTTTKLTTYSTYNFKHGGEKHKISVQAITTNTVTLLVQSTPQLITLTNGTPKDVDLNNDSIADITIVATIARNTATLNITPIQKKQESTTPVITTAQKVTDNNTATTPEQPIITQQTTPQDNQPVNDTEAQQPITATTPSPNNTPFLVGAAIIITIIAIIASTAIQKRKQKQ